MALPASGAISFNDINVELGVSGTTTRTLNDSAVRTLFGIASGAIDMNTGHGKANQFNFTISSNQTNLNLRSAALSAGWGGTSKVVATINSGVYVYSTSTGSYALTVDGAWPGGVSLINNGYIIGQGGNGGQGGHGGYGGGSGVPPGNSTRGRAYGNPQRDGNPGSSGGPALYAAVSISITNNGTIAAGGGGGGGSGSPDPTRNPKQDPNYQYAAGGGGGAGGNGGSAGAFGAYDSYGGPITLRTGTPAQAGSLTSGGSGGIQSTAGAGIPDPKDSSTPGGAGGAWGSSGGAGHDTTYLFRTSKGNTSRKDGGYGGSGGSTGNYITGNGNVTWVANGTRSGGVA
jgi:hypothetical protein